MLAAIISLGGMGLVAAVALGLAAKKFAVAIDPREAAILEVLSGANCGACGYPGCGAYAKAVVTGEASPTLCPAGGQATVQDIARIMGVTAVAAEAQIAIVLCQGDNRLARAKYRYQGLYDCQAAQRVADGPKECPGGCLGLGTCARVCPFDAIEMTDDGLAVISREKCTGCRKCVAACPRQVIRMTPARATVHVLCNSHDKGALVRKYCQVGCIACQICKKVAPEAYRIEDQLARIDYEHAAGAEAAVAKCPTKCIRDFVDGYPEGSRLAPAIVPAKVRPPAKTAKISKRKTKIGKRKTFPGGLHPPDHKGRSALRAIENCPLPDELVIPLSQHIGAPAEACVQPGDKVGKGQVIGQAKGFISVPVHASTSGEIVAVEPRLHASGKLLPAVVLRPDGKDAWVAGLESANPETLTPDEMRERIRAAGVVGLGGATFPTHVKLSPPAEKSIDTLILNGAECEPYLTADHRLMLEEAARIIDGVNIMARILGARRIAIGIEANKPDAIAEMRSAVTGSSIEVVPLKVKYPQGAEKQLILAITGREVPSGGLPMDIGVLVQNVGTAVAIGDAVRLGRPLIESITTVSGPGIAAAKNLRVRIGTPLSTLVAACGGAIGEPAKIIIGGPMMGTAVLSQTVPITRGASGLLLFREGDLPQGPPGPCIRCGRCVRVCPAHILPTTIAAYARLDRIAEAEAFDAMDCIECGCCTYGCPAAIPLVQTIRQAKGAILARRRKI